MSAQPQHCSGTPGMASWGRCEKAKGHEPPCTHDPADPATCDPLGGDVLLTHTTSEVMALLDAKRVGAEAFRAHVVAYFRDPKNQDGLRGDSLRVADIIAALPSTKIEEPYCDVCGNYGAGLRTPVEVCKDCYEVVKTNYMGIGELTARKAASREYQLNHLRAFTSSADFVIGEILPLRPEMGGGRWRVIELISRDRGFARCIAEPLDELVKEGPNE